jgi:hypothetical protein
MRAPSKRGKKAGSSRNPQKDRPRKAYGAKRAAVAPGLAEIVFFASPPNARSIQVMQRIGMTFSEAFDHARFEAGHPLRRHVLSAQAPDSPKTGRIEGGCPPDRDYSRDSYFFLCNGTAKDQL